MCGVGVGLCWFVLCGWLVWCLGCLDGVVFSGGEFLFDFVLLVVLDELCVMGYVLGLYIVGFVLWCFGLLLLCFDWVGLDVKVLLDDVVLYDCIIGLCGGVKVVCELLVLL